MPRPYTKCPVYGRGDTCIAHTFVKNLPLKMLPLSLLWLGRIDGRRFGRWISRRGCVRHSGGRCASGSTLTAGVVWVLRRLSSFPITERGACPDVIGMGSGKWTVCRSASADRRCRLLSLPRLCGDLLKGFHGGKRLRRPDPAQRRKRRAPHDLIGVIQRLDQRAGSPRSLQLPGTAAALRRTCQSSRRSAPSKVTTAGALSSLSSASAAASRT